MEKLNVKTLIEIIIGIGGVIGMGYGAVLWVHKDEMSPVLESLNTVEQSAVVYRIRGLVDVRCDLIAQNAWQPDLQVILDTATARYEELTGRPWNVAECE